MVYISKIYALHFQKGDAPKDRRFLMRVTCNRDPCDILFTLAFGRVVSDWHLFIAAKTPGTCTYSLTIFYMWFIHRWILFSLRSAALLARDKIIIGRNKAEWWWNFFSPPNLPLPPSPGAVDSWDHYRVLLSLDASPTICSYCWKSETPWRVQTLVIIHKISSRYLLRIT